MQKKTNKNKKNLTFVSQSLLLPWAEVTVCIVFYAISFMIKFPFFPPPTNMWFSLETYNVKTYFCSEFVTSQEHGNAALLETLVTTWATACMESGPRPSWAPAQPVLSRSNNFLVFSCPLLFLDLAFFHKPNSSFLYIHLILSVFLKGQKCDFLFCSCCSVSL